MPSGPIFMSPKHDAREAVESAKRDAEYREAEADRKAKLLKDLDAARKAAIVASSTLQMFPRNNLARLVAQAVHHQAQHAAGALLPVAVWPLFYR